jgi:hypothetical protein
MPFTKIATADFNLHRDSICVGSNLFGEGIELRFGDGGRGEVGIVVRGLRACGNPDPAPRWLSLVPRANRPICVRFCTVYILRNSGARTALLTKDYCD